jgi:hypothetical protein
MPAFDFSVEETTTSAPARSVYSLPDGWYVLKVVQMKNSTSQAGNQQVNLMWDVAEGEFANVCADNGWFDSKHTTYLQITGRSAGFTKRVLHVLADSNPGFESGKSFLSDNWPAFVGKVFGARLVNGSHEYNGKTYRDLSIAEVADVQEARASIEQQADAKAQDAPVPPQAVTAVYDEDIPF